MADFPAYKTAPVEKLVPYARNSRTHSPAQIDKIAASIKEFGFLNPVITDGENGIVAGHGRVLAAQKLGIDTLPVIEAAHLTEAQKRAYIIADNKLADLGGWDFAALGSEVEDLAALDFNMEALGFDESEIDGILARESVLPEKKETIRPMHMTHLLVSLPNSVDPEFLREALALVVAKGGRVDYGGN